MGVPIDPFTMTQTVEKIRYYVETYAFAHIVGINSDKLLQMRADPELDQIVRNCEVVNADGASMVLAASKLSVNIPERVAGIDLMGKVCELADKEGYRVFLLGAKFDIVEKVKVNLENMYPGIKIAGMCDGYFSETEFDQVAQMVDESNANIIFVGITSPKKERIIEYFRNLGMRGVYIGVGGSFDVVSGEIARAPLWLQHAKLEWLFRMLQEPRRLAKRYILGNIQFLMLLNKEAKKQRGGRGR